MKVNPSSKTPRQRPVKPALNSHSPAEHCPAEQPGKIIEGKIMGLRVIFPTLNHLDGLAPGSRFTWFEKVSS